MVLFALFVLICDCHGVYQRIGDLELMSLSPLQVEVEGNIAYTLEYQWFNIYDVSDPSNPISLSNTFFDSELRFMQIRDNYAFISGGYAKFIVLDISDNTSPTIIDEISFNGTVYYRYIKRFCLDGNYAYLDYYDYASYETKLLVVDISDPNNCTIINEINTNITTNCMFINDVYLYLFGYGSYLGCVFDISDFANPVLLTTYSDFNMDHAEVISDMVYCINADDFRVYDFSDPLNIVEIVHYENDNALYYVSILDNKAYLACGEKGIKILDITDLNQITEIGIYDTQIDGSQGAIQLSLIDENTIILTEWSDDRFLIIDVSDPHPPSSLVESYEYFCRDNNLAIYGNLMALIDEYGVYFFDISNIIEPIQLLYHTLGNIFREYVFAIEDYVFVTFSISGSSDDMLYVYDTSDPNNIHFEGSCLTNDDGYWCMAKYNDYIFLPSYNLGLTVYDLNSGNGPSLLTSYPSFYGTRLSSINNYVYMALENSMILLDISDPNSVNQVTQWPMPGSIMDIVIEDNILYIWFWNLNIIRLYDISDNTNLVYLNEIQLNENSKIAWNFIAEDNKVYISDLSWNEIIVYDTCYPANPVLDYSIRWNLKTRNMVTKDNYLFVGNSHFGCSLFDTTDLTKINFNTISPDKPELTNYPNPFNPTTTISFSIPKESNIELSIYNIKGQKVKQLVSDQLSAVKHLVVWD